MLTPEERNEVHLYKKRRQAGGFGAASSPSQGIFVESSTLHAVCIEIDTDTAESSLTGQSTLARSSALAVHIPESSARHLKVGNFLFGQVSRVHSSLGGTLPVTGFPS